MGLSDIFDMFKESVSDAAQDMEDRRVIRFCNKHGIGDSGNRYDGGMLCNSCKLGTYDNGYIYCHKHKGRVFWYTICEHFEWGTPK